MRKEKRMEGFASKKREGVQVRSFISILCVLKSRLT